MTDLARDLPRSDLYRLVVTLRVLTTDEGGRRGPIASGHRPDCWFGEYREGQRVLHGLVFHLREGGDTYEDEGTLWVPLGSDDLDRLLATTPTPARRWIRETTSRCYSKSP